ncbi:putative mitochondrial import inner membrane translocase subunit tim44 [Schistosoma mansoni]|uniref:putative mitochondrial import inner membrane translocase subunit tim44 n=1 Tax=Schistosoma mansoni TaxID=6183 RepID=UPI0001A62843|nr:putative mitochondrial import inner membrane translocase subunit tim44 [Schistosoma mansoni]|eukprot:XP_018651859.1 putative mitochondrial import inner membrane translocase subunit tim44 [Schistosoma mansoni]
MVGAHQAYIHIGYKEARYRYYSKGFIQSLIDKVKEESNKDTELKENIRKFREETAKLEQTKELRSVREFYKKIEKEIPVDTVGKVRDTFQSVKSRIRNDAQQFTQNETVRKGVENLSKAGEHVKDATKSLSETEFIKAAIKGVEVVGKELESERFQMYQAPNILKTRSEISGKNEERAIQPDSESSGVVVHKDSKWFTAWQDFKENNQYVQRFFDLKAHYEESDHLVIRSLRFVTDRLSNLFGGLKSTNDLQQVLDEIIKMDPSFNLESFIRYCRFVVIPNVLEAIVRGDLRILHDWCHEVPYNVLATPLKQMKELGYISESRILDVHNVDVQMGKMMEQGPVLIITFQAQQINCIRDKNGNLHEGDPNKVLRVTNVWALCRDQSEMNPLAAWRVLDIAMMPSEQWM